MSDVAYFEESPDSWARAVEERWTIREEGTAVVLAGLCPTCGHASQTVIEEISGSLGVDRSRIPVVVTCRCTAAHEGRPEGRAGCGRAGSFVIDLTSD